MNPKFIFFKDRFINTFYIVSICVEQEGIKIITSQGMFEFKSNSYDESEKKQLLEDLKSFM
jgi:hypothetical protein